MLKSTLIYLFVFLEKEEARERQRNMYALTRDQTHNLGVVGRCSNQLSQQARVTNS